MEVSSVWWEKKTEQYVPLVLRLRGLIQVQFFFRDSGLLHNDGSRLLQTALLFSRTSNGVIFPITASFGADRCVIVMYIKMFTYIIHLQVNNIITLLLVKNPAQLISLNCASAADNTVNMVAWWVGAVSTPASCSLCRFPSGKQPKDMQLG